MSDPVDELLTQWAAERPDLDVSPMAVIGRISRVSRRLDLELGPVFARHDLDSAAFDVLATLRRSGPPYALSPRALTDSAMITSSATAQRLNRLEERGLVSRTPSPVDGRGVQVTLTDAGHRLVDEALPDHVGNEHRLLSTLTATEQAALAALLAKLGTDLGY